MTNDRQLPSNLLSEIRSCAVFFVALALVYGFWLVVFWPGVLGEDSLAILLQVENPETFNAGKTAFWYYYVRLLYEQYRLAELPIGLILILSAFILARILGWCWSQRLYWTVAFLSVFVCLAPHLVFFIGSLYPDGIFAIAVAGLLFEIGLIRRRRKAGLLSLFVVVITLPFAVLMRTNGIIFLLPAVVLVFMVDRKTKIWLSMIIAGWCSLAAIGLYYYKHKPFDVLYPLAVFETVNFLQPRPMNLWIDAPRVLPRTVETMTRHHPIENWLKNYDPDYWDPLNFGADGPQALRLPAHDRNVIVRDFFRYNLWHNIPKFMSSRVNVFLVASFAQGGFPGPDYSKHVLDQTKSQTVYRKFHLSDAERLLKTIDEYSYKYRMLLWTPFLGIGLMIWALGIGIRERDAAFLLVSLPMLAQLAGIFIFSIAGEYRYLFHFFTLPLALLPLIATHSLRKTKRLSKFHIQTSTVSD